MFMGIVIMFIGCFRNARRLHRIAMHMIVGISVILRGITRGRVTFYV
jgi:hypothetical protein